MSPPTARILETKLNPPASTATQVPRTAISEEIAAAATVKLVLVRAPAGFGKTTAMAQIRERMEAQGIATAWLTLDRADNDVSRFLNCLAEAALRLGVEEPHANGPLDAVAALAAHDAPFTLFLDDFEVVQEPAVLGLVREIVEHLPRRGQIVIGSRGLPDLGMGRLRARGQLIEIDTDRLRFSLEETSAFFGLRTALAMQALPADMLSQLHRKTEGWVAAIWLASMALERHGTETGFVERFSGSDRAVAEYLAEDVLAHQPKEIRDFLLRTSILRQLDASVCQALNPRVDCAAILERLAASNLFLTPVGGDGDARAWRYHSLFADFLRAQLAREQPGEIERLHLAASGWYESQDRPVPAIDHAIEGGDHPYALTLLDSYAAQFLEQGRMRMLARWFSAIPEHQLREHPFLQPIALWATCFTHGPWDAMRMLEQSGCLDSPIPEVRASAHTLVPLLLAMQDRHDEAYEVGRQSLSRLPTGLAFADSVLLNAMAHILAVRGDQHEARRMLEAAREQGSSTFNRMYTESLAGLFDLQEGRLRQATARLRMAVDSTHAVSYNHSHGNAWAGVLYAGAVYETNQLVQAEHLLNVYLPLARDVGLPDHMILSHVMRSRIAFHAGDIDAAFQALTELEYLGHHRQLPRVVAGAKLERSRMLLLQGNGPASRDELMRADDPALWERERRQRLPAHDLDYLALAKARWDIAFGDPRAALGVLDAEIHAARASAHNRRALKLKVLRAMALQRAGDMAAAIEEIGEVLQTASQEGFVRLILDEGTAVGTLIHRYAMAMQEAPASRGGHTDPILADYLQRLLQLIGPMATPADAEAPAGDAMKEPLTRKEIRVLQLLAEGYSNNAMAEKLFVSDSTVRTHLRNINMKLDAKSRTQAVAIARKLGVIR
ncbi:LuxR C-terminal-related transcriptional regulator [Variovorax sp. PAMC26660]|uniref:LuxR C-terminal-related transcriptional regulator n=1 Tax=Variovorax sp. PAMC26660 TaxID=2762322 RepID=UPI00164E68F9|nr:LuxR C-terminal-related transcriptional regulator [Variovorax sp. PAMC26660]QNK69547.1 helix-turn-helix transcriptional regulator [Variovorax sp. PAMC26660]